MQRRAELNEMSVEMQISRVSINGLVIVHIGNPAEEVQIAAVSQNGLVIKYLDNPSSAVQIAAVTQNYKALQFINNPCAEAVKIAGDNELAINRDRPAVYRRF